VSFAKHAKILICLGLALGCPIAAMAADRAQDVAKEAEQAEHRGDALQAFILYSRAAALDPSNVEYQLRKNVLEAKPGFLQSAAPEPDPDTEVSVTPEIPQDSEDGAEDSRLALPPPSLKGSTDKKSFKLKGDARTVVEQVAQAFGLQVVFEADYQGPSSVRLEVDSVGFADALRTVELLTNSFFVPVNEHLALVVRDTPQRRTEVGPVMTIAIPIPERLSVQDAQEIVTAVQQTMEIRRASVDALRRTVLLRDSVSKVSAAKLLFGQLSKLRAQVAVEVEVLSVTKNSSLGYGLTLPNSSALVNFSSFLHNTPSLSGFMTFFGFGGGATLMGLGITNAATFATVSRSSADTVLRSEIVSIDGQPATLHIGDRYPIVTSEYVGSTAGTTGTVYAPPPTITFEDLGLVLKITPSIHGDGEVSLDVDAEYKLLGAGSSNGIPVISNRKFQGKVRLADGQWAVIAGLTQESNGDTRTGIAWLSDLPWIGRLFTNSTISHNSAQLVIVLKPHLLNLPPWEDVNPTLWVGTDSRPLSVF